MSMERLAETLAERVNRGRFLRRVGTAAIALMGGALSFPRRALAGFTFGSCAGLFPPCTGDLVPYQCCCLLQQHDPACASECTSGWCWVCCLSCFTGERLKCCECSVPRECSYGVTYDFGCTPRCEQPA